MKTLLLIIFLFPVLGYAEERKEQPITLLVDILVKPERNTSFEGTVRKYSESQGFQRLLLEPWSKFQYRIGQSHTIRGPQAVEAYEYIRRQIENKSPTGWCGHEAEYGITVLRGDKIVLKVTLSAESGSSVYIEDGRTVIGHFSKDPDVLELLQNTKPSEQSVPPKSDRAGG